MSYLCFDKKTINVIAITIKTTAIKANCVEKNTSKSFTIEIGHKSGAMIIGRRI